MKGKSYVALRGLKLYKTRDFLIQNLTIHNTQLIDLKTAPVET